MSNDL